MRGKHRQPGDGRVDREAVRGFAPDHILQESNKRKMARRNRNPVPEPSAEYAEYMKQYGYEL